MRVDILFETSRFNLSRVGPHFINPCCFGEDVAGWLRERLRSEGWEVTEPDQEDWGWYVEASRDGASYTLGLGGIPNDEDGGSDEGEWRVMVTKHRSLIDRLRGKNRLIEDEPILTLIESVLRSEPEHRNVHREQAA